MRRLPLIVGLLAALSSTGCYYGHLAVGQLQILWNQQPLEQARADPDHPEEVRRLLGLVEPVRAFALELGLSVDDQYTSYLDRPEDRIVTTLVRTRGGSLEPVPWWFPLIGELPYKGYFDRERAEAEAQRLQRQGGYDVCVSGVSTYSTLGWLDDPVTHPMVARGPASLVETLLHEFVHATAFLPDDADFNEGVAQFIGQEAAVRFFERLEARPDARDTGWPAATRVRDALEDRRRLAEATLAFRDLVETFDGVSDRAVRRAEAETEARNGLSRLPLRVLDATRAAQIARLSDACLVLRGTYVRDAPRHAAVLEALGGDLKAMIARLRRWADGSSPSAGFFEVEAGTRHGPRAGDDG